jgi:uncharacterized protein YjbJ (UPF0337 family)
MLWVGSAKSERNHRKIGSAPKKTRRSSGSGANRAKGRPAAVGFVEVEGTLQDLAGEATRKRKDPPKKRRRSSNGGANRANGRSAVVGSVEAEGTSQDLAAEAAEVTRKPKDLLKKRKRSAGGGAKRANGRSEDIGSVEAEGTSQDLSAEAAEVTRKPRKKRMSVLAKKKMRGIQRRKRKREKAERFVQKYPPVFSYEFRKLAVDFRRFYLLAIPFKYFVSLVPSNNSFL